MANKPKRSQMPPLIQNEEKRAKHAARQAIMARRLERVSFFRRLANEKNPDAAILNEDVIIVRKPV